MDPNFRSFVEGAEDFDYRAVNIEDSAFSYNNIIKVCTSPNVLKFINWKYPL